MTIRSWFKNEQHQLGLLLAAALLARLAYFLFHQPVDFLSPGGDSLWYLQQGWLISHHALPATLSNVGPLYPLLLAAGWVFFPGAPYPAGLEVLPPTLLSVLAALQAAFSLLMVWWVYQIAHALTGEHRPSLIAAIGIGLGPAFVMEPFLLLTETVFMGFLALAVWIYERALRNPSALQFAFAGIAFGLASLTRPILLLFPFLLVPHVWMSVKTRPRIVFLGALLAGFLLVLIPWRIYVYQGTGDWIPEGFASNLWIGSVGDGTFQGAKATDALRQGFEGGASGYTNEAVKTITEDPIHWIALHIRNTIESILQPHGTDYLPRFQTKQSFVGWLKGDRSLAGLWAIVSVPGFLGKIAIYLFHYTALIFGVIGAWLSIRKWRVFYVPFAVIIYFIGTYGVLTILPRYLFPTQIFFWILAGVAISRILGKLRHEQPEGKEAVPGAA